MAPSKMGRRCTLVLLAGLTGLAFSPTAYFYTKKGNQFYKEQKYKEAEKFYRKAQIEGSLSPEVNYNLGNIHFRNGDFEKAASEYARAQESERVELKTSALYNRGNSLYNLGSIADEAGEKEGAIESLKGAVEAYKNALAQDEKEPDVRHNLRLAEEKLQKLVKEKEKKQEQKEKKEQQQKNEGEDKKEEGEEEEKQQEKSSESENEEKEKEPQKNGEPEKDEEKREQGNEAEQNDAKEPKDQEKKSDASEKNGGEISRKEAEAILDALKGEENKLQKAFRMKAGKRNQADVLQDW
ncbi:MAG: tetratricopeptide repeat protein [Nitrospinota bacterium]